MRQSDGSDLLGANDPRSSDIGVIYVAPTDDRQSVLAAILTQDKLGRKQVAVVLPEQNRAFQRPVDFEGLKNMRRGLKTQIVFIAPSGPGPAEFARQRRFTVYSSLENFARSFQNDGQTSQKRGWSFGRKQSPNNPTVVPVPTPADIEREPTAPLPGKPIAAPQPEPAAPQMVNHGPAAPGKDQESHHAGAAAIGGAGLAAGLGIGALSANQQHDANLAENVDYDALPPVAPPPQTVNGPVSNAMPTQAGAGSPASPAVNPPGTGNHAEPAIIAFPTPRPRSSGKIPAPPIVPVPSAQPNMPPAQATRRRSIGQAAAMGAGAGAGTVIGRTAGGGVPPNKGNVGGAGGGGSNPQRRTGGRRILFALLLLLLTTVLCIGGIALAAPSMITPFTGFVRNATAPSVIVSITPKSQGTLQNPLHNQYDFKAVKGKPDPKNREVQARTVTSTSSDHKTVNATGIGHTQATRATGQLTFVNVSPAPITIASTVLIGSDGVQVKFNGSVTVPAGNPPTITVNAYAVNLGASGNIKAFDIDGTCCVANNQIFVKNTAAFSGGQDPQSYTFVQQSDINGAANVLSPVVSQNAQSGLKKLLHTNESFVGSPQCPSQPDVNSDHNVGDKTNTVTVTASVTCTQDAYDSQAAQTMAISLFVKETNQKLDSHYMLKGGVPTTVSASVVNGTIIVSVTTKGVWVYKLDPSSFAGLIAGKTKNDAISKLQNLPCMCVDSVSINLPNGVTNLPSNPNDITINVVDVPGFPGSVNPTPGPGSPTSSGSNSTPEPGLGGG